MKPAHVAHYRPESFRPDTLRHYRFGRRRGLRAVDALRCARTESDWLATDGVRLIAEPDDGFAAAYDAEEDQPAWILLAQVALEPDADPEALNDWETVDSVGAVVGDPFECAELVTDLKWAAIEAARRRAALREAEADALDTVRVHRFHDSVALSINGADTEYLTPGVARETARALRAFADDVERVRFTASTRPPRRIGFWIDDQAGAPVGR